MLRLLTGPNPHRDRAISVLKSRGAELTNYFLGTGKGAVSEQFGNFVDAEVGLWKSGDLKGVVDNRMGFVGVSFLGEGIEFGIRG